MLNFLLFCFVAFGSYVTVQKGNFTGIILAAILLTPVVINTVTIIRTGKFNA